MTIYLTDGLPSPREAMRQAVERAQLDEWEGARVWLDIARELRHGELPPARTYPRPLDNRSELAAEAAEEAREQVRMDRVAEERKVAFAYADAPWADVEREGYLGGYVGDGAMADMVRVPVEQPSSRTADTEIIRTDRPEDEGLPRCGQEGCGLRVELALDNVPAIWVHALTQQARCPASFDREPTFATPSVDARG